MTNFKRFLTLFLISTLAISVWGADITWTWTASSGALGSVKSYDASLTGSTSPSTPAENTKAWHVERSSVVYTGWSSSCIQFGSSSGAETVTLTSSAFSGTIKSVYIECSSYNNAHNIAISVGGTTYLSATSTAKWTTVSSKGGTGTSSGEIQIAFTSGSRALYIKSITVTYNTDSGTPVDPTITFNDGSYTIGGANLDLTSLFSSNSSGAVTYTVSNANGTGATVSTSGTDFHATVAGSCTVQASQAAASGYNAKAVTAVITVNAAASAETYDLVTDANDLEAGDEIIILDEDGDYAISNTQNANNRGATTDFTLSGTTVTVSGTSDVQVLVLGASSSNWTLHATSPNSGATGYLYAASSGSNYIRTRAENSDGDSQWSISINASNIASIVAQGSNTRNVMQYNSGSSIFACYGTASQTALKIYRKSTTNPTITVPSSVTGFTYNYGEGPDTKTMTISGKNLTGNLTVELEDGDYQISLNNSVWTTSLTLTATAGVVSSTTVYVRLASGLSVGTHNGSISVSGGGATSKNVTLEGAVTLECATPTLTFGGTSSVEKLLGSGKFTIPATSPDNTLSAAITYSSSNTSKATVDENTGEVTLVQATGSGSPVTITATLAAKNTGVACQNQVTTSYTLTIYNKITWLVNSDEYTTGTPTTQVLQGGKVTQLPDNPDGDALCGGKVFIGWTDAEVLDPVDAEPSPMYKTASDLSSLNINANKTFYAVFAAASTAPGSGNYLLVSSDPGATNWAGDYLIAYDATTFADGRIGGKDDAGSIGIQNSSVSPGTNLSGTTVAGTWGDTYNVTITKKTGSTNTYLLQTKDGKYNYQTSNSNGLACTANKSTAEGYPLTITYYSSSDIEITVPAGPVLHYNPSGYFRFYKNGGQENIYLYKKDGGGTTYSDYSTVCGTCLPAPTAPTVTPKSNRATITWPAVPDATGYTVTCTGGAVSVVGTTATITGLTAETSYNFTIRSQGSDPYTCFPAYNGSFTTTSCEDSPVLGIVTVTTTSATIPWTCEAATATIRIYEDAECNTQVGSDYTPCTSPYTVTPLTSNTTYYYKVFAGGTCPSAVGTFTTEEIKLDIAEWQTDAVVVSFNGDADLTLTTFTEETHGDPHANVADDIFFSKYFEAAASVKLLAIFNGTLSSVDLSNYELGLAQSGTSGTTAFSFKKFSEFEKSSGGGLTEEELLLKSNEELIIITYTAAETDQKIIKCAQDDEENSKFSTYIRVSTPNLQFNGDDVVCLKNPDGDLIDLIGAGTKDGGSNRSGASFQSCSSSAGTMNGFMDQPGGWYTEHGYKANTDNTETSGYGLSSNRCLLIRRKHVKSGHNAVLHNASDFLTLGDYTYMGDDYEGEWKGVQIPGSTTEGSKPGLSNSCDGFAVVGGYNYNDYYVDFEPVGGSTTFDDLKSDPFDGTYEIPVSGLLDKACTLVRIELKDGSDNLVIRKDVKVPIMISGNQDTKDDIFHSNYKDAAICRECDVVILGTGTLTKVADGTTGDINEVRDLKIYPGGKLIVPEGIGYNYTVNSLAFRRQEDEVATADIQGGLTVNEPNSVFLDIRIDPSNWHYISLPYDVNVSDITFSTGDPATLGADYLLKWYNGERRAATQAGGCWEMVSASGTLKKGIGYLFAIPGDGLIKREFRFPMANTVIAEDKGDKNVAGIYGYGCDKDYTQVRANHRGWNLIGNPYFLPYTSDITNPLLVGKIVPDYSTVPWDGHYKFDEAPATQLRYIVEPVNNGKSEYKQVAIEDYEMTPFTCYFVQVGGTDPTALQGVEFHIDHVERSPIVRRSPAEYEEKEDTHPVWCAINLTNSKGEKDITTMLISNDFTDEYDMMDDLVKMRGTYYQYSSITTAPVLASRNNEGEMAFNALPDSSAKAGIPLHYFTAYNGEYTISYNNKYDKNNEVVEVKLLDTKTNEWYDLKSNAYTFTTNREDNKNRFIVSVSVERQKAPQITTGIDALNAPNNMVRKIFINGHVYIQRGGAIYDITGKEVFNF